MYVSRSKQRLSHLNELTHIPSANSEAYTQWSRVRLDRILVDYMLREGFSETAIHLAKAESIEVEVVTFNILTILLVTKFKNLINISNFNFVYRRMLMLNCSHKQDVLNKLCNDLVVLKLFDGVMIINLICVR